jgi:lipocalin-like protein
MLHSIQVSAVGLVVLIGAQSSFAYAQTYVLIIRRNELEKFASQNIREGTAAENRAVVRGSIAHTGTYVVDETGKSLTLRIETSTFPNQDRTEMTRAFTLTAGELRYVVPTPSVASGTAILVWRRVN